MRIRPIAAGLAAAAALSLGAALPAAADSHATVASKAANRHVKVYVDAKYKGATTSFHSNRPHLGDEGWGDKISSAKNLGNRTVTFYKHGNYKGAHFSLAPGDREAHFGNRGLSDAVSSIKFR
ncbi:peptidase inhibitor family I36 protein [Streptomyces sp. NPDC059649]|uniref:peptidase inhibitor family I36 protein n=1 Tax=Streptomyces sp. NPDC059649 TaxID=3346895 RepID=UPI0036B28CFC